MNYRTRIQNFLMAKAKEHKFIGVRYDEEGQAHLTQDPVKVATCLANETSGAFEVDSNQGRQLVRKRVAWTFQLLLGFDSEVSISEFEEMMTVPVPSIPADKERGYSSVLLHLISTEVVHPVIKDGSTGTDVRFTFEAVVGRT